MKNLRGDYRFRIDEQGYLILQVLVRNELWHFDDPLGETGHTEVWDSWEDATQDDLSQLKMMGVIECM